MAGKVGTIWLSRWPLYGWHGGQYMDGKVVHYMADKAVTIWLAKWSLYG